MAEKPAKYDKYRVQLDFTPEAFTELEKLKTDVEASSRADTVRYAMRVLRWVINALRRGETIAVVKANGDMVEVQFPFLPQGGSAGAAAENQLDLKEFLQARQRDAGREIAKDVIQRGQESFRATREAGRQSYEKAMREQEAENES